MATHIYAPGEPVVLSTEGRPLEGTVREITLSTALLAFDLPFELPTSGTISWPDGASSEIDLSGAKAELVVRVQIPRPVPSALALPADPPPKPTSGQPDLRRTIRVDIASGIQILEPLADASPIAGKTLNISSGGALILTEAPLIVGKEYICEIDLPDEPLVVRIKPLRRMGHNSYALRFLATPDVGHRLMRRLFAILRTGATPPKRLPMNFRKS